MKSATLQLIEAAERLNPSGVIGDGTVFHFHELAARARLEQGAPCAHSQTIRRDGIERCTLCGKERVYSGNAFAAAWAGMHPVDALADVATRAGFELEPESLARARAFCDEQVPGLRLEALAAR